jgi:hypothetical protein|tara:strand:+ start:1046 stop:1804 length:759 start_codon:yes stop_codon:yes gene_type:complete
MVHGLENFQKYFNGLEDRYTLIGGVACYLSMKEAALPFRATKDLDIVLCAEALDREFVQKFWDFVQEGEYEHRQKSTGDKQFFRFINPKNESYPVMLELFSRKPDDLLLEIDNGFTPIPTDEEVSSLSAILLDEGYYQCIQDGKEIIDGVPILKSEYIIPFKMRAWLDLTERSSKGDGSVNSKDIKKHKNDVFRISQLLSPSLKVELTASIKKDILRFMDKVTEKDVNFKDLKIKGLTLDQVYKTFYKIYSL